MQQSPYLGSGIVAIREIAWKGSFVGMSAKVVFQMPALQGSVLTTVYNIYTAEAHVCSRGTENGRRSTYIGRDLSQPVSSSKVTQQCCMQYNRSKGSKGCDVKLTLRRNMEKPCPALCQAYASHVLGGDTYIHIHTYQYMGVYIQ